MLDKETTSIIEIDSLGPIVHRTIPVPTDGGVVVLRSVNGGGKTTALDAVRTVLGGPGRLPRRDDAESGSVSFAGTTVKIAKRQTRIGAKVDELDVVHLEDQYDISKLVDPGMVGDEENDTVRIRSLVQLSGVEIDWSEFEAVVPQDEAYDPISVDEAKDLPDPVVRAAKVKRILDAEARRIAKLAEAVRKQQAACETAIEGIDLSEPHDRAELQAAHSRTVATLATLQEKANAASQARDARAKAETKLKQLGASYSGPSVADAESELQVCQSQREAAKGNADAARKKLDEAQKALAEAESAFREAETNEKAQLRVLEAARDHDDLVASYTGQFEADLPNPPSPSEIEAAQRAVNVTENAIEEGVKVREAAKKQRQAVEYQKLAERHEARAQQLREAGKATDQILSRAVKFDSLKVLGGRLVFVRPDGNEEFFDRLSDGERWTVAIEIGAQRVSEKTGDGTRLLILPQNAWQDLDPNNRDVVNDVAITEGIVVLTAEAARGSLRAVLYGEQEVTNVDKDATPDGQQAVAV